MSDPTTVSPQGDGQAPARTAERARGLIERQLWVLGRLGEVGLNVALAIERQAMAAADDGPGAAAPEAVGPEHFPERLQVVHGDLALAYARVSRAVRLTLALQARLVQDLQALDEGEARRQAKQRSDRQAREAARKAQVERIVERVIQAEAADDAEGDRLAKEAYERLDEHDIYGDLLGRPVSEVIARICRDLGLAPDWSRLAEEAWAQQEIDSGVAGAPLMALRWVDSPPLEAALATGSWAAGALPAQSWAAGPLPTAPRAASP